MELCIVYLSILELEFEQFIYLAFSQLSKSVYNVTKLKKLQLILFVMILKLIRMFVLDLRLEMAAWGIKGILSFIQDILKYFLYLYNLIASLNFHY